MSKLTRGSTPVSIDPRSFQFITSSSSSLLKAAIERYKQICFPFHIPLQDSNLQGLSAVTITVLSSDETLQLGVNESYSLSVSVSAADIQAETVFGAIRGLESFAQLIDYNYSAKSYSIQDLPISISDSPRFPWRGLMIDTARHYLEVQTILTMIDAMAYNKMNTLHWHITDSQSFPLQSVAFPNLAKAGAYAFPEATYDAADVKTIVNYGYERGVRVVPEFDMPGHTYSWGLGYPDIIINCSSVLPAWGTAAVTLDITNPDTYKLLNGFLAEVKSLFMDDFMHLGSDEVQFACWNNSHVLDWMQNNGIASFDALEQYFEDNLAQITTQNQITNRVFWEDAYISNGVKYDPATSMFTVWRGLDALTTIVQAGYKAVLANGFYLDVQQPGSTIHYEWVDTWQDFYTNEPFRGSAANLTAAERELVLGGETCMWGEAVDDENIFSRVWVRASGTAEKLWSSYDFTTNFNVDLAQARLMEFRCRLKQRGIHSTAIRPDYCPTPTSI